MNGKYVWDTAKRVCDYINAHDDHIHITSFGENREVMKKGIRVIKEAHNVEVRDGRQQGRKGTKKQHQEGKKQSLSSVTSNVGV